MRRPVRKPVSRCVTAPNSSSECRLPFITICARPVRTSSTALAAAAWLWATSMISNSLMLSPKRDATSWIFCRGPTRMGKIIPASKASIAPFNDVSSHGWATAVGKGETCFAAATNRSYLSCRRSSETSAIFLGMAVLPITAAWAGSPFLKSPFQRQRNITGQTVGPGHDFRGHFVAQGPQFLFEVVVGLLAEAGERARPLGIGVVDTSAPIRAESAWERHDLQLMKPALGRDADGRI